MLFPHCVSRVGLFRPPIGPLVFEVPEQEALEFVRAKDARSGKGIGVMTCPTRLFGALGCSGCHDSEAFTLPTWLLAGQQHGSMLCRQALAAHPAAPSGQGRRSEPLCGLSSIFAGLLARRCWAWRSRPRTWSLPCLSSPADRRLAEEAVESFVRHGRTDALKRLERLVEHLGHQALRAVFSAAVGRNDRRLRPLLRRCCVVFDRDLEVAEGSCEGCRSQEASWSDLAAVFWARCQLGMPCAGG